MPNYRRKPIEVEAFKWTGLEVKSEEIPDIPLDIPSTFRKHLAMHQFRIDHKMNPCWLPFDPIHNKWVLPGSWLVIEHNRLYIIPQDSVFEKLYELITCPICDGAGWDWKKASDDDLQVDDPVETYRCACQDGATLMVNTTAEIRELCDKAFDAGGDYEADRSSESPPNFDEWWKLNKPVNAE